MGYVERLGKLTGKSIEKRTEGMCNNMLMRHVFTYICIECGSHNCRLYDCLYVYVVCTLARARDKLDNGVEER